MKAQNFFFAVRGLSANLLLGNILDYHSILRLLRDLSCAFKLDLHSGKHIERSKHWLMKLSIR